MAGENTVSTLQGLFKVQYAQDINSLIPQHAVLQKLVKFVPADKTNGSYFAVPTVLRSNQGVSYLGEAGGVASLSSAVNAVMKEAQIKGSELNVRGQLSYKALSQAATAGPRAFKRASSWLVEDLASVAHTRLEISGLYGQTGIGQVEGITNVSGTTYNVVVTDATFAAGIWVLLEGAQIDFFNGSSLVAGGATINKVTTSTRTLNVTIPSGGGSVAANHDIFPKGAKADGGAFSEMVGLYKQFTDTSSTLFNLDRSSYTLIQGNTYSSTGALTKAKIVEATMLAVDKGLMSDATVLVSTKGFAALNAEDMALRVFDSSYNPAKSESGAKELIYDNVNGKIKVVCHPMIKNGEALIFSEADLLWVGSSKPTFEIPGMADKFFRLVDGSNAIELQNYCDLAVYALKPCQTVVMTGITY